MIVISYLLFYVGKILELNDFFFLFFAAKWAAWTWFGRYEWRHDEDFFFIIICQLFSMSKGKFYVHKYRNLINWLQWLEQDAEEINGTWAAAKMLHGSWEKKILAKETFWLLNTSCIIWQLTIRRIISELSFIRK